MQHTSKIKTEYCSLFDKSFCYACLSSDRKLSVLGDFKNIFRQICYQSISDLQSEIFLCWECRSLLKKVKNFQERVVEAQIILNSYDDDKNPPKSLSNLLISAPSEPIEIQEINDQEHKLEISLEVNKCETPPPPTEIKEEPVLDFNDDFDSYDYIPLEEIKDELADTLLKELDITITKVKVKEQKLKEKQQSAKRKKRYKMTYQNLDNAIKKIAIEENEIDNWLERERNSKYYQNLKSKCDKCVTGIGRENPAEHHKKYHIKSKSTPFKCTICQQYLPSEVAVSLHTQQHCHYHSCGICGYDCYSKYNMRSHMKLHSRVVQCLECPGTFVNTRQFFAHYRDAHRIFICDYCNKKFKAKTALEGHIYRKHTTHQCDICNVTFSSYRSRKEHYNLKHRIERTEASYCVQCNIQFDTIPLFRRHINSSVAHIRERNVQPKKVVVPCPSCPNVYARKTNMMNHYRQVHAKQSKYRCTICDKQFLNRTRYKEHMMFLHEGQKKKRNKICDVCGRGFYDNRILRNHERTHTGERPFACEQCDARFTQKAALNSHVKFIHMKTKRRADNEHNKMLIRNEVA